jgi:ParG
MTGKKKKVDFSVRPKAFTEALPATPEEWVQEGKGDPVGPQKRLTLNLPAGLHTAFKSRCVVEGVSIQDKVRVLIERELAVGQPPAAGRGDTGVGQFES